MKLRRRIPAAAVRRLPLYLRELEELQESRVEVTSSSELARRSGYSSEQIRKDLAYFGAFGTRGLGYDVEQLAQQLRRILGLARGVSVAIVGAGNLGTALVRYSRFHDKDPRIAAVFDTDRDKVGQSVAGVQVQPMEELAETLRREGIRVAVLSVPEEAARGVFELLCAAGVLAVLNFTPIKLERPAVYVHNVDLTTELQALAYFALGVGAEV